MKLKAGYKLSKFGESIPIDWVDTEVGNCMRFSGGSQPPKDTFSFNPKKGYIRLLQIRDYKSNKHETFIPIELAQKFCDADDIMIGRYGPPIFQILKGISGAYNVALIKVLPENHLDRDYAFYFLKQDKLLRFVEKLSQRSSGQTGVDLLALKAYPLYLPPTLEEQQAIATALSDVDTLISKLDKLIAKKKAIKQGAMQRLLKSPAQGGQRLPGFEGEWVIEKLQKLTRQIIDGTHHTPRYTTRGIPFLRVTDIQSSSIDMTDLKYVSKEEHETLIKRCNPEKGDILLSKNGTIGIPKVVDWDWEFSVFVSLALIKIKDHLLDVSYLSHYLSSEFMKQQIKERSKQGTVTNLHLEEIREFDIPVPPTLEEQRAIDTILTDMTNDINSLENKKSKYLYIKQGMMQELLTGKTRLV